MKQAGVAPTVYTYTSLINACARCGETDRARAFLDEMTGAAVGSADKQGSGKLFSDSRRAAQITPNEVTYTALLKSFSQASCGMQRWPWTDRAPSVLTMRAQDGALDECFKLLDRMATETVAPNLRTYNTLLRGLPAPGSRRLMVHDNVQAACAAATLTASCVCSIECEWTRLAGGGGAVRRGPRLTRRADPSDRCGPVMLRVRGQGALRGHAHGGCA